jgi:hypothetical protein
MPDYSNTTIYKLWSENLGPEDVYYGHTIRTLKRRLQYHINNRNCCSIKIIDAGKYHIEEVEQWPCANKREALVREGWWQKNNPCINQKIEGYFLKDSPEAQNAYNKQYYEKNKEKNNAQSRKYYQHNQEHVKQYRKDNRERDRQTYNEWAHNNPEKVKQYRKQHREKNVEAIREHDREHYEKNKERIKAQKRERVVCERCGCESTRGGIATHRKSKKCLRLSKTHDAKENIP